MGKAVKILLGVALLALMSGTAAAKKKDRKASVEARAADSIAVAQDTVKTEKEIHTEPNVTGTTIDEVLWVVGDEAILRSDVENMIQQAKAERVTIEGDPYCTIPEQLAVRKLFMHQGGLDSVNVNESMVNAQVEARINELVGQIGSEEKMAEYFGRPIIKIRENLREQAREQSIVQQVQRSITSDDKASPSEVRKYWSEADENKFPMVPTKVEVQIITLSPRPDTKQIADIKSRLREYKQRVDSGGESFAMLATLYSDDQASAVNGGELGLMGKGQLVKPFAEELFSMSTPGKVSRVVETEFGYHIIQLIERRGDKANCRHILLQVKPSIEQQQMMFGKLDSIANEIRNGNMTFEDAVKQWSTDKDSKMSDGVMENPRDMTTRFEYQHLPSEVARQVYSMEVGAISRPFSYVNANGQQVCAIVKLKHRYAEHRANLNDDYPQLKQIVVAEKQEKALQEWIKQKIGETYVLISPSLQGCDFHYDAWKEKIRK
ncbi:MAG: peptidylprolyl isomerase [Paludibacteraceae bacterium]|nr:peptidylprolyl isomerase [Paludibacteraceae bacterium]